MAGLGIRLYPDEMLNPGLAPALRRNGYDALHCAEVGLSNQAVPDEV